MRGDLDEPAHFQSLHQSALAAALAVAVSTAVARPRFGNASPTAGSETSQRANESADQAIYKPVEYMNVNKKGPALIVIPGEIKSSNATFLQKFTSNNIADFAEVELSAANFQVLERSNLGPSSRNSSSPTTSATRTRRASILGWAS